MDRSTLNITPVSSLAQFDCNRVISSSYVSAAVALNDCLFAAAIWNTLLDDRGNRRGNVSQKKHRLQVIRTSSLTWKSPTVIHTQQRFSKKEGREGGQHWQLHISLSLSIFSMFSKSFVFQCQVAGRLSSELGLFYPSTPSIFSADTRSCTYTHIDMHAHTWLIRRHPHNSIRLATRTKATIKDSYLELMTHGCVWLWSVCVCTVCLSVCGCVCVRACMCVRVRACVCVIQPK